MSTPHTPTQSLAAVWPASHPVCFAHPAVTGIAASAAINAAADTAARVAARLGADLVADLAAHPAHGLIAAGALLAAWALASAAHRRARWALASWRHTRAGRDAYLVTITPPPQVEPTGATHLWSHLHGLAHPVWRRLIHGNPHLVFEYLCADRAVTLRLWVPGSIQPGLITHAITAAWPGAITTLTRHPALALPRPHRRSAPAAGAATGHASTPDTSTGPASPTTRTTPDAAAGDASVVGVLRCERSAVYPLRTDFADTDPIRHVLEAATARGGETTLIQIAARPATPRQTRRARHTVTARAAGRPAARTPRHSGTRLLAGALEAVARGLADALTPGHHHRYPAQQPAPARTAAGDPWQTGDTRALLDKTTQPLWETHLRYLVATTDTRPSRQRTRRLAGRAGALATAFALYTSATNRLRRHHGSRAVRSLIAARGFGIGGDLLAVDELAALAHLPTDPLVPGLDRAGARPTPPPVAVPAGGRSTKPLGRAQVGGHAIALAVPDARYHLYIPGKTGAGKSVLITHLALADYHAGRGTVVIDPAGDLITDILDRLPANAADRVWLLDPDTAPPPRLNPLSGPDPHLAVDHLVGMFAEIFARHWGPRADDVLRSACLTLLRTSTTTPSLEHLVPLLTDHRFRSRIVADLDDPAGLTAFWDWYDTLTPGIRAQVVGPVLARLRQFLLRDFVRACVGTRRPEAGPTLDLAHILDHGGLLLCRLPKGQLGDDTARLLGSFVVAQVWQTITARAALPPEARRDCGLYIDEAHNFLTLPGSVDDMLAEARKYRLSMTLAHQNLTQLPRDLRDALSANARNKILFTLSPDDAHILARHTSPELDEHDLAHLDAYTAAARLVVNGRETRAFTLTTTPPTPPAGHRNTLRAAWQARATHHHP